MRLGLRLALGVLLLLTPPLARADSTFAKPGKVEWKDEWRKFQPWEGALTLGATAFGFVVERRFGEPITGRFRWELPIVDTIPRDLVRSRDPDRQRKFAEYSDMGFRLMAFFPYVFDAGFIALGVHQNPEVAAQLFLIDAQALTLSGITQLVVSRTIARERPYTNDCGPDGQTGQHLCGGANDLRSLYSGHAAAGFTSAGLNCVHHQHIPLYGGGPVETWACMWSIGVATMTGVFRIVSDNHYMSDVLVGAGVGWFYGYIMPKLVHYRSGKLDTKTGAAWKWMPAFAPSHDGGYVTVGGAF